MAPAEQKGALKSSFKGLWNYNGLRDYPVQLCFDWLAGKFPSLCQIDIQGFIDSDFIKANSVILISIL